MVEGTESGHTQDGLRLLANIYPLFNFKLVIIRQLLLYLQLQLCVLQLIGESSMIACPETLHALNIIFIDYLHIADLLFDPVSLL